MRGAGRTLIAKLRHLVLVRVEARVTCSEVESHVRPIAPDFAKRRFPTSIAREQYDLVSCSANDATAAANTATRGLKRYSSVTNCGDDVLSIVSISTGATSANVAEVADIPTQRGVMALTRSALASRPSASAAHWIVAAAISFPSATATFPVYSAPIPMAAEKAAEAGAKTSVTRKESGNKSGPEEAAATDKDNRQISRVESCGNCPAILSNICISRSKLSNAFKTISPRF